MDGREGGPRGVLAPHGALIEPRASKALLR